MVYIYLRQKTEGPSIILTFNSKTIPKQSVIILMITDTVTITQVTIICRHNGVGCVKAKTAFSITWNTQSWAKISLINQDDIITDNQVSYIIIHFLRTLFGIQAQHIKYIGKYSTPIHSLPIVNSLNMKTPTTELRFSSTIIYILYIELD